MHMENPKALANIIINDIYNVNLPIPENPIMAEHFKEHNLQDENQNLKRDDESD